MKEKLEFKHLAPYLTHWLNWDLSETEYGKKEKHRLEWCKLIGINVSDTHGDLALRTNIETQNSGFLYLNLDVGKPILRPLSQLTKEIEHNGEKFVPCERLGWKLNIEPYSNQTALGMWKCHCKYAESALIDMQLLFEWHFDVFNLIPQDLATVKT